MLCQDSIQPVNDTNARGFVILNECIICVCVYIYTYTDVYVYLYSSQKRVVEYKGEAAEQVIRCVLSLLLLHMVFFMFKMYIYIYV